MIKLLFLVVLLRISTPVIADNNNYNNLINSAELAISDSNYKKANQIYHTIFSDPKQYMFAKDVWNYALSSLLCKDTITTQECLVNLIKKDASIEEITNNKYLSPIFKRINRKNINRTIINYSLYNLIDSLCELDQKYRIYDSMYVKFKKEISEIDSTNAIVLKNIFDKYGFPSEQEIGATQMFNLNVLLLHQNYGIKRLYDFTNYIYDNLYSNKLESNYGINLIMRLSGKDPYCDGCEIVKISYSTLNSQILTEQKEMAKTNNFIIGYYKQSNTTLSEANTKRKKIGIASVAESRKKTIFTISNSEFGFNFGKPSHYVATDKKQYEWFLKDFIIIKSI